MTWEHVVQEFLRSTDVIDFQHPAVLALARKLRYRSEVVPTSANCFHWVRDNIRHSLDHGDTRVTIAASEVLEHGTGMCYAKSHLLAALLRANNIPCGLVYQRMVTDTSGAMFCLHGLNAVWLPDFGWYRMDPRGDRTGISTSFDPPHEHLAFAPSLPGEELIAEIFANPLPTVIGAMSQHSTISNLAANLPDWQSKLTH